MQLKSGERLSGAKRPVVKQLFCSHIVSKQAVLCGPLYEVQPAGKAKKTT